MSNYEQIYHIGLLDDLHNFFPAILYQPQRFRSVQDLLQYISQQAQSQFNLFDMGLRRFEQTQPTAGRGRNMTIPQPQPLQPRTPTMQPIRTTIPSAPARTSSAAPYMNIITETYDLTPALTTSLTSLLGGDMPRTTGTQAPLTTLDAFLSLLRMPQTLDPVIVAPTQEQINAATHVYECLREQDRSNICSICQEDYTDNVLVRQIRHCNHTFHRQCIDQWFQQNTHCPVCRFDIRNHSTSTATSSSTSSSQ